MPLYEYACESCNRTFEVMQRISESPLTQCPECGASVRKLISRTSFQLKGTGWYATDYKRQTPKPVADTESKADPKTGASDSKAEPKAEKGAEPNAKGGCGKGKCGS